MDNILNHDDENEHEMAERMTNQNHPVVGMMGANSTLTKSILYGAAGLIAFFGLLQCALHLTESVTNPSYFDREDMIQTDSLKRVKKRRLLAHAWQRPGLPPGVSGLSGLREAMPDLVLARGAINRAIAQRLMHRDIADTQERMRHLDIKKELNAGEKVLLKNAQALGGEEGIQLLVQVMDRYKSKDIDKLQEALGFDPRMIENI